MTCVGKFSLGILHLIMHCGGSSLPHRRTASARKGYITGLFVDCLISYAHGIGNDRRIVRQLFTVFENPDGPPIRLE